MQYKITQHPILEVPERETPRFNYPGLTIEAAKGQTIAASLHQAGFPIHSHSLKNRERSLECGIGKCGPCEMLVEGMGKRICSTDHVKEVQEIPNDYRPKGLPLKTEAPYCIYDTVGVIIGACPAGLAARKELIKNGLRNIVVDNNDKVGGPFTMQTHPFFFF